MTDERKGLTVGLEVHKRRVTYERRWFEENEFIETADASGVAAPWEPPERQPPRLPAYLRGRTP